ncbi:MAG TPA: BTAD domain-containing putative transcriptional regulator [Pseudonocardiaceae bacterium]|jgi:DNA-binding SARP family transcriptional activator/protein-tyrosine-phosphatase
MLHVHLFGGTRVLDGTRVLGPRDLGGLKPQLILQALALHRGRQVSKDQLTDILWSDRPPPDHIATLESYVSLLRRRLEPGTPAKYSVIRTLPRAYALDRRTTRTDLDLFDALVAEAGNRADREAQALLDQASALVSADLHISSDEAGWAEPIRADYHQRALRAAIKAGTLVLRHDTDAALRLAGRALELNILCEPAWRLMMQAHAAAGHRDQALRSYRSCRRLLARELGLSPDPETRGLMGQIIAGHANPSRRDGTQADLGMVMDAAFALFEHRNTGDVPGNLDDAVHILSELLGRAEASLPTRVRETPRESVIVVNEQVALRGASARLRAEFDGVLRPEIVHGALRSGYDDLVARSSVRNFLPLLAERAARRRLRDLATGQGGIPTVVFAHIGDNGYCLMALGLFANLAGDHATGWSDGPGPAGGLDARTVAAMAERGIDITDEFPPPWTDGVLRTADVVVTLGAAGAPSVSGGRRHLHWELASADPDDVRAAREEIERRVRVLLVELGVAPSTD